MSEPSLAAAVLLDFGDRPEVARMKLAGVTLLERQLRDLHQRGVTRVSLQREVAAWSTGLSALGLELHELGPDAETLPRVDGTRFCGVTVRDLPSRGVAEWALMQTGRRSYDGPGDRFVIRPLSLRVTRLLTRLPVRPNHITFVSLLVGLTACAFAAGGGLTGLRLAGGFIFLQVVLDSSDGELARVRFMGSRLGMWFDNLCDDLIDNLFIVSVGAGLGGAWFLLGLGAAALRLAHALIVYRDVARAGTPGDVLAFHWWFERQAVDNTERFAFRQSPLAAVRAIGRRDLYVLLFAVGCLAGFPAGVLLLGVGLGLAYGTMTALHVANVSLR